MCIRKFEQYECKKIEIARDNTNAPHLQFAPSIALCKVHRPCIIVHQISHFAYQIRQICPQKGNCETGRIFLFLDAAEREKSANGGLTLLADF